MEATWLISTLPKNSPFYHLLYRLNLSFTNIVRRCRELEETRVLPFKYLRQFQGFGQELQAEINQELLLPMHEHELDDWYRYGKVRDKREKYLRDPDDVFIDAEHRRRELARQGKKPPHVYPKLRARKAGKTV